ncbi:transposase [Sporosarcina saromensis]|uniref:Transposase n=1 Tax=Sporosarcina saromensis TaxID=359365 RepID=A0ABU4G850_9BACL|nr:transposase [Sporosarcina saromensis]MDW0113135.1 transposase [Sporosarcina saromensis]
MELYNKENASPTIKNAFDLEWEKGVQQGLEQGLEQGLKQGVKKVVVEMLRKRMPTDFIAEVTHLEKEEIEKMRETLQ